MLAFVNEDGTVDYDGLYKSFELSARAGYRVTNVDLEFPAWDAQQKRDRLLGVGVSGLFDFQDASKLTYPELQEVLKKAKNIAIKAGKDYAKECGTSEPLLSTTVKPSGTSSQLYGESSGAHRSFAKYYIRRVRIASNDPLIKVCEELGYNINPEVGQEWDTCKTKVVDFYVKSKGEKFKDSVSSVQQLKDYIMLQENFVEHNTSITISCNGDKDWQEAEQFVYDNWDKFVAVSFMDSNDSFYQLLPYEEITEEQYLELNKKTKPFNQNLLTKYEEEEVEEDLGEDDQCASGICSIR